jgi:hypothetical protein
VYPRDEPPENEGEQLGQFGKLPKLDEWMFAPKSANIP